MSMKTILRRFKFANSRWSRMICPCCGERFSHDDIIMKISIGETSVYFHEECLSELDGKEALEFFEAEIEEVEI